MFSKISLISISKFVLGTQFLALAILISSGIASILSSIERGADESIEAIPLLAI
jgi:hypothetical protein